MELSNKPELISFLKTHNLWTQKKLGQNFLVDKKVLEIIIEAADLQPTDTVLEIGPGVGTLTYALAPHLKNGLLLAVEKDFKLVELLRRQFKNAKHVKIVHDDIRRFDLCSIEGEYKVVANMPYYLTSPLIRKLLEAQCLPDRRATQKLIVLTVQKEVAERITAQPGDSNRGILTVMVELLADSEIVAEVPRSCFYPEPEVDSAIIRLKPNETKKLKNLETKPAHTDSLSDAGGGQDKVDYNLVMQVAKAGFSAKRRQLHNSLAGGLNVLSSQAKELLGKADVDPQKRAEDLTVGQWQKLAKIWQEMVGVV